MGYYQESGKINTTLTIIAMLVGAAIIGLLAYGYSFLTDLNPFIYLNFLATAAYVLVFVFILGLVQRVGKVRSYTTGILIAVILAAFGLFAVWVTYIMVVFEQGYDFALSHFVDGIEMLSQRSYSIGRRSSSIELSGWLLITLWIIEAAILLIGPIFFIVSAGKNDLVYCEDCDKWAGEEKVYLRKSVLRLTKKAIEDKIMNQKVNELIALESADANDSQVGEHYEIKFTSCGGCKKAVYLSVNFVSLTFNNKNEIDKKEELIFPFYELDMHSIPREILNPTQTADMI
ncbi:MAG: hypothetical protein ACI8ZM_003681 [Crocinitomix sp.]|jgi:hypothetical protein